MSYADRLFKETCRNILENGTDTKNQEVRPHWEDGTPAYTIKQFGVVNRYDLRKEFPAITLRRIALKSAMDEILWIYQKKSNDIHDLNSHIWDQWADADGKIGKAYGWQMNCMDWYKDVTDEKLKKAFPDGELVDYDSNPIGFYDEEEHVNKEITKLYKNDKTTLAVYFDKKWHMSQIDKVMFDLKLTPFSRRIMTSTYQFRDLSEMGLHPCAYSMTYNVTEENGQLILNAILNQRSQDMLAANGWNVVQYAILLMMIAREVNMIPGELVHVIADCHIYDRHVPMIKELLDREEYPAPTVRLNPDIKNFYDFTTDDLIVENYQFGEQIKNIPIAV